MTVRLPTATYRIQLQPDFGFGRIAAILDYLHALGISDIYASPVFKAHPGSLHGYDVLDPNQLNPELGDHAQWQELHRRRRQLQMGWLQDIVPNHMDYSGDNPFLADALESGPSSPFYHFLDIQWDHPQPALKGAVRAPFLGDTLENCLEKGEIGLRFSPAGLQVNYYDQHFPLALAAYPQVLREVGNDAPAAAQDETAAEQWRQAIDHLLQAARMEDFTARRHSLLAAKQTLWSLYQADERRHAWLDARLDRLNHSPGEMRALLQRQYFKLCDWRTAAREINYRRFFDINGLIALRQESPAVFDRTHALVRALVAEGVFTGLRIDHIDGLRDPAAYFEQLRHSCGDVYIVAEKILAPNESLPADWPVQGSTGYEFAVQLTHLLCFPDQEAELTRIYQHAGGNAASFAEISRDSKAQVLRDQFQGDLHNTALKFQSELQHLSGKALEIGPLEQALAALLVELPVYRTYLASGRVRGADRDLLQQAADAALRRDQGLAHAIAEVMRVLLLPVGSQATAQPAEPQRRLAAVAAFEQLAAPLTAKGIEDTALYRYNRLAALNEVGGSPEQLGESRDAFHYFIVKRQASGPFSLNTLSTHDTKRSGDVRARLLVIAEMADEWAARLAGWRDYTARYAGRVDGHPVPDDELAYLLYQIMAATWPAQRSELPAYRQRIEAFARKAAREAKLQTSWLSPHQAYESALGEFLGQVLSPLPQNAFWDLMQPFAAKIAHFGFFNALAQSLIQLTAPGIPDIYQGTEIFDDSLVDPDNRRAVDFDLRRRWLQEIKKGWDSAPVALAQSLMAQRFDGRIKLFLTWIALKARRQWRELFLQGDYLPLVVTGSKQRHVLAFARAAGPVWALTVVPRFPANLVAPGQDPLGPAIWSDTTLHLPVDAPVRWRNLTTDAPLQAVEAIRLADLLVHLPVALLIGEKRP